MKKCFGMAVTVDSTMDWTYLLKNFLQNCFNFKIEINTNENILFSCISKNSICTLRYFDKKK